MEHKTQKQSRPKLGFFLGALLGVGFGTATVFYLQIESPLDQVCVVGISLLAFQLLGATVGAAIGKE
jgi:uncharacterized membrane protein YfcA